MAVNLVRYHPVLSDDKQFVLLTPPVNETEEDRKLLAEICNELNVEIKDNQLALQDYRRLYERVSRVQLEDDLIPKQLHHAAYYIFENFLQYAYKKEDIFWNISDNHMEVFDADNNRIEIPRPNHGIAHTLRVASYIPLIIQHVKNHLDPKFIQYYENYTPKEILMLQLCALFSVVGRKDETGFGTNLPGSEGIYKKYRKDSAKAFEQYCRSHQTELNLNLTEDEIQHYSHVVKKMGDPMITSLDPWELEQLITHKEGYKLIFLQDETQLEATQTKIRNENNPNVKPIIIVGEGNKKIAHIYENNDFKTKECTIPDEVLKDKLFVTNKHHELIVKTFLTKKKGELDINNDSISFAKKIYQFIEPNAKVSDLNFVYTSLSDTLFDNLFLHQAHCMDLYRCREKIEQMLYDEKDKFNKFCMMSKAEEEAYKQLIIRALETIPLTGDRIFDGPITTDDTQKRGKKDYDYAIFQIANKNPSFTMARINALSPKKRYATQELLQGPRPKSKATFELEKLIHALLNPGANYTMEYDKTFHEIEITVDGNIFNLTKILQHNPDFEQLILTPEQLQVFADMKDSLALWPFMPRAGGIPTEKNYQDFDPDNKHAHLHYGEKLAITSYTEEKNYRVINYLLRNAVLKEEFAPYALEAILIAAVASHGLAKVASQSYAQFLPDELQILSRKEIYDPNVSHKRMTDIKEGHLTSQKGFFSTSVIPLAKITKEETYDITLQIQQPANNPIAKMIKELSYAPNECEALFLPGYQFLFRFTSDSDILEAIPYRSIQDLPSDSYSAKDMKKRRKLIKIRNQLYELKTKLGETSNIIAHPLNRFIQSFDKTIMNFDLLSPEDKNLHFQKLDYELNALIDYVALTPFKENIDVMLTKAKNDIARIGSSFIVTSVAPDPNWINTIYYAAIAGDINTIEHLQQQDKIDIKQKFSFGNTFLHPAAFLGHAELVQFLIKANIPLDEENDYGNTALALAVIANKPDVIHILLDHKANTTKSDPHNNRTVYHHAEEGGFDLLQILYEKDKDNLPVLLTNLKNNTDDLKLLSALVIVASINHDNDTRNILSKKWDELSPQPLAEFICKTNDASRMIELLNKNVLLDNEGNTLLHYLVQYDISSAWFKQIQEKLHEQHTTLNALNTNHTGLTPLYLSAKKAYSSGSVNAEEITALLFKEIISTSSSELIAWLSKPEIEEEIKFYLLHVAIKNNDEEMVRTIKMSGLLLNLNQANLIYNALTTNSSPIIHLIDEMIPESKKESIYTEVLTHCKSAKAYHELLKLSMDHSFEELTQSIFDQIAKDKSLLDILHLAASEDNFTIVEAYLKLHPEHINEEDMNGWTPLRSAVSNNNIDMVKLLIAANVIIDLPSLDAASQHPDIMKLFYEYIRHSEEHTNELIDFIQSASEYEWHTRDVFLACYKIARKKNDTDILKAFSGDTLHLQTIETQWMNLHDLKMGEKHNLKITGINHLDIAINMARELEALHSSGKLHRNVIINHFTIDPTTLEVRLSKASSVPISESEEANGAASDVHALATVIALLFDLPEDPDFNKSSYFINKLTRAALLNLLKRAMDDNPKNRPTGSQLIDELFDIKRNVLANDNAVSFGIMNVNDYLESQSNEEERHRLIAKMKKYHKIVLIDTIKRDASAYEMIQRELFDSSILAHNHIFIANTPTQASRHAVFITGQNYKMRGYFPYFNEINPINKKIESTFDPSENTIDLLENLENTHDKLEKDKFIDDAMLKGDFNSLINDEENIVPDTVQLITTEMIEVYKKMITDLDNKETQDKFKHLFEKLALDNVLIDFIHKLGDEPNVIYPMIKMALSYDNLDIQTSIFQYFNPLIPSLLSSLDHSDESHRIRCEILNLASIQGDDAIYDILLNQDQESIIAMLNVAIRQKMWNVVLPLLSTLKNLDHVSANVIKELKLNLEELTEITILTLNGLNEKMKFLLISKLKNKENALGILLDEKVQKKIPQAKKPSLFDQYDSKQELAKTYYDMIANHYPEIMEKHVELKKNPD